MDLKKENLHVLGMAEAVTKVGLGKPVFILSRIYPETPISALTTALGFVEVGDKPAPAVVDEKPGGPKKPGPKKKALPKAEPEEPAPKPAGKIDVGKIRACYTATPPGGRGHPGGHGYLQRRLTSRSLSAYDLRGLAKKTIVGATGSTKPATRAGSTLL